MKSDNHIAAQQLPGARGRAPRRARLGADMAFRAAIMTIAACFALFVPVPGQAQQASDKSAQSSAAAAAAAAQIADFFGEVGDQIYEDCIFELSQEQIEVQQALIVAYIKAGASAAVAHRLAVKQIHPPKLSAKCEQIRHLPKSTAPIADNPPPIVERPAVIPALPKLAAPAPTGPAIAIASKKTLPQWDCAPGVDYVTIQLNGYPRKLTDGEICNPFEDVVREVPFTATGFRLGYTIRTGRLFVISSDPQVSGQTIAWAISGREMCRNNPDPDCFATRAVGPLPPGEYSFGSDKAEQRITWGPKTKRNVAGIYLTKLWGKDKFNSRQIAAILARGNIAIHERLKGEMSEACLGLEPKGWAYVASLIKSGRATGVNAYIDEPYPQVAGNPPIVVASSFSLKSMFK